MADWALFVMSGASAGKTSRFRVTQWLGTGIAWRPLTSHLWRLMLAVAGTSAETVIRAGTYALSTWPGLPRSLGDRNETLLAS